MSLRSCRLNFIHIQSAVSDNSALCIKIYGYICDFNDHSFSSAFIQNFCVNGSKHFRGDLISRFFLSCE